MKVSITYSKKEKKKQAIALEQRLLYAYLMRVKELPIYENINDFIERYGRMVRFGKTCRLSPKRRIIMRNLWVTNKKKGVFV